MKSDELVDDATVESAEGVMPTAETQTELENSIETSEIKFDLFDEETIDQEAPSLEWEVQATEQPTFDFTDSMSSSIESSENEIPFVSAQTNATTSGPEVIRHQLEDEVEEQPKSYRIQSTVLPEEIAKRNEERVAKIQEITSRIQNSESISEYESQPAYLRRNIEVNEDTPSKENNVSRFGLSGNVNGDSGLRNNSYLHDNVD